MENRDDKARGARGQAAARREILEYLGESASVSAEEAEQIRREWEFENAEQRNSPVKRTNPS